MFTLLFYFVKMVVYIVNVLSYLHVIVLLGSFANGRRSVQPDDASVFSSEMTTQENIPKTQAIMNNYIRRSEQKQNIADLMKQEAYRDFSIQVNNVRETIDDFKSVDAEFQTTLQTIWPDNDLTYLLKNVEDEFEKCLQLKKHKSCTELLEKASALNTKFGEVMKKFNNALNSISKSMKTFVGKIRDSAKSLESAKKNLAKKKEKSQKADEKVMMKKQGDYRQCLSIAVQRELEKAKGISRLTF